MRPVSRLLVPACCLILCACASKAPQTEAPKVSQSGDLKVHPGLIGLAVPRELAPAVAKVEPPPQAPTIEPPKPVAPLATQTTSQPVAVDPLSERSFYFDYRSAGIRDAARPVIDAHAKKLAASPKTRIRIEGHADERGSDNFNLQLGLQRARAVRALLIANGAKAAQIKVKTLGKMAPKIKGHDETSWAENRRADLIYERE